MATNASGATGSSQQGNGAPPAARQQGKPQGRTTDQAGGQASPGAPPPSSRGMRATGDDIMAAVDGEGQKPSLAHREAKPGAPDQRQPQKAKAPPRNAAEARAQAADETHAPSDVDLEAIFKNALQPQELQRNPNDLDLTDDDGQPISPREANRIQTLNNRAKAAEDRALSAENQIREMGARFQQLEAGLGEHLMRVTEQNARLQGRLESILNGQRQEQLSPEERVERDFLNKASTAAERKLMGHVQKLQQRLDGFEKQAAETARRNEIQANRARYSHEGQHAARSVVLQGFPDEAVSRLMPLATELVLAKAWGKNTNAANAAKMVRDDFLQLGLEFVRAQARTLKQKKDQSDGAPAPAPAQRSVGNGEPEPTYDELRAAGYREMDPFMEWDLAGRPALR